MSIRRMTALLAALSMPLIAVSCGDDDGGLDADSFGGAATDEFESADDFADAVNDVTGADGASGSLVFDGSEYPIEAATCLLDGDTVDVGTVGENYRIFVSGDPSNPDLQILDPDGTQWFDGDPTSAATGGEVTVDGSTITGEENTWWNNGDDRVVDASFVIVCP